MNPPADMAALCRAEKEVFPFLPIAVFQEAERRGELIVLYEAEQPAAGLHYHHRRDGITTIHEIVVAPPFRRKGYASHLLRILITRCRIKGQHTIQARCPENLPANRFYERLGFQRVAIEPGKKRRLCLWQLPVSS